MKVYIAGKLTSESEREKLEEISKLCESYGMETFLPHRDVGLFEDIKDIKKIFEGDIINGFKNCDLVIAMLDGLHVGAGTAWEVGYAYANNIPIIGVKTDESVEDSIEYLSAILISSMEIVDSMEKLKNILKEKLI